MDELTGIFKALFVWMGIPQITIDQVLGYQEVPCLCKDTTCQKVRVRLTAEFHVVKNAQGQLSAQPVRSGILK